MIKEKKKELENLIKNFHKNYSEENENNGINERNFLDVFIKLVEIFKDEELDYKFYVPIEDLKEGGFKEHSGFKIYEPNENGEYKIKVLNTENEKFYPVFDSLEDLKKGDKTSAILINAPLFLGLVHKGQKMDGVILNPWSNHFFLYQDTIKLLLERIQKEENEVQ